MQKALSEVADLIHRRDPFARFSIELWDGTSIGYGNPPAVRMRIRSQRSAARLLSRGFVGFGESYMSGDLDVEGDMQELLRLGMGAGVDDPSRSFKQRLRYIPVYMKAVGTRARAARNITYHYDRGNAFYALYLDSTMTYSCAYFRDWNESLEQAQLNKYEHIGRKLMLSPGDHLVDVGCGWGGMLIYAARHFGVTGVGNTLSLNQYEYATRRIRELGLQDRIRIVLKDYRDLEGKFDKFVSIGMFEHVGKKFIPQFMKKARELLKPGGTGLLHTIGKSVEDSGDSWLERYIFPGSYLPTLCEVSDRMEKEHLPALDVENLRLHYAKTLDHWAWNFEGSVESVRGIFDESFVRMWRLYLHAASVRFKYGDARLYQILFSNGLSNDLPINREYVYKELSTYGKPLLESENSQWGMKTGRDKSARRAGDSVLFLRKP